MAHQGAPSATINQTITNIYLEIRKPIETFILDDHPISVRTVCRKRIHIYIVKVHLHRPSAWQPIQGMCDALTVRYRSITKTNKMDVRINLYPTLSQIITTPFGREK